MEKREEGNSGGGEYHTGPLFTYHQADEPDSVDAKMAATAAANQLKLQEMESACNMLLFVKGFAIAVTAKTMERESNGKSYMMCPSATPSGLDQAVVG